MVTSLSWKEMYQNDVKYRFHGFRIQFSPTCLWASLQFFIRLSNNVMRQQGMKYSLQIRGGSFMHFKGNILLGWLNILKEMENKKCWWGGTLWRNCWEECKTVQPLWKTVWWIIKKLNKEFPHEPAILLLHTYSEELKTDVQTKPWALMFLTALFTIVKRWKQP